MEPVVPERGDLYRVALHGKGHVLRNPHYAVVVSHGAYNWLSTVVVVPFSTGARPYDFRPEAIIAGERTRALVDQVMVVDKVIRDPNPLTATLHSPVARRASPGLAVSARRAAQSA